MNRLGGTKTHDLATDHTFRNAIIVALLTAVVATVVAVVGWNVFEFDRALFVYAQSLIVSLALTAYRFTIWLHRPPTLVLYQRAITMLRNPKNVLALGKHLCARIVGYFALNKFVWKRGLNRWAAHWPIMVGCVMAFAIVIPLIFGWVWFETPADDFHSYEVMLFGQHIRTIPIDGIEAFVAFHGLVWASFPVIAGCSVALWRRLRDRGDQATQTFGNDLMPLLILLSIAVTGLLMTISYSFLGGAFHSPLAKIHCVIVCGTLLWLPYSKLFHIPQRSLKLAHMVYEHESEPRGKASCLRCGEEFADQQQIDDLIEVQRRLGYRYELCEAETLEQHRVPLLASPAVPISGSHTAGQASSGTRSHYQNVCPRCRRATLVLSHGKRATAKRVLCQP